MCKKLQQITVQYNNVNITFHQTKFTRTLHLHYNHNSGRPSILALMPPDIYETGDIQYFKNGQQEQIPTSVCGPGVNNNVTIHPSFLPQPHLRLTYKWYYRNSFEIQALIRELFTFDPVLHKQSTGKPTQTSLILSPI